MRVAVISDTHDRLPAHVSAAISRADEIWHLGDVCSPAIVETLRTLGPPVRVVCGNCDHCAAWPITLDFEVEGHSLHLVHIPPRLAPPTCDLLLHGHTHVPRDERLGGVRFLNPGSVGRGKNGHLKSYAWLQLHRDQAAEWSIVLV